MADLHRPSRLSRALAVAAAAATATGVSVLPPAAASATHGDAFPPKANSAWVYDSAEPGTWVDAITAYNAVAGAGHALNQVYSYGTDMEMYCPDNDGTRCAADDLYSFYTEAGGGPARTAAYHDAFAATSDSFTISPIIDGRTDANGYLRGFNELSPSLAAGFADKVAAQVCADPHVDGIQFDLEPFDVSTKNGQYYFYLQLAKNFAGRHTSGTADDPYGCVDADHPQGRFYSVFTFAAAIRPGTESAANVRDILATYRNGYLMDSLYDLSDAPAGTLNSLVNYTSAARAGSRQRQAVGQSVAHPLRIRHPGFGVRPRVHDMHGRAECHRQLRARRDRRDRPSDAQLHPSSRRSDPGDRCGTRPALYRHRHLGLRRRRVLERAELRAGPRVGRCPRLPRNQPARVTESGCGPGSERGLSGRAVNPMTAPARWPTALGAR